ncbi:molybdopterin synthase catalytic subunit MoaE [Mangrovimicrobium sediminis]|uniref:Molybdopterin synthase catalytic subunit n=1 Tax=Mangrovimicrobium sediminis TaxID=2562682 RepID=A0A4Z0M6F1_9GAMM|nr:molybdopterin synthase catalytic subunit MoaE [Haliea sp. SAOS-164]TGD75253.1 molybdopterin synthase catalytic subunit MoaE [Haliea sp. SAOS-164]
MKALLEVSVQESDFDLRILQGSLLRGAAEEGGVATFTGYVRGSNDQRGVSTLLLEHYPGMTERSILAILEESAERWPLLAARVVHRVGELAPGDQIVWVGVSAAHREAAFAACEFIMDYLKTRAPFWKKERGPQGEHWVDARDSDSERAERWQAQQ